MEERDIEAAKRLKNRMWTPALKDFYESTDVVRYFKEVNIQKDFNRKFKIDAKIIPPESFFTEKILKKRINIIKNKSEFKKLLTQLNIPK